MSLPLVLLGLLRGNGEVIFVKEEHLPQGKVRKDDPVGLQGFGTSVNALVNVLAQAYFRT